MANKESYEYAHFDPSGPDSILAYAKNLEGMSFQQILELGIAPEGADRDYSRTQYKSGVGNLVEERYFGYKANSDARPISRKRA